MDNAGWKATRKAAQDDHRLSHPQRSANGQFTAIEHVDPMNEPFTRFAARGPALPIKANHEIPPSPGSSTTSRPSEDGIRRSSVSSVSSSSALERSRRQQHQAPRRMNPHLQVMCGPLLRYDTVDSQCNYRAACMIVTADAGSVYEPHPSLSLEWDPERPAPTKRMESHRRLKSQGVIGPKLIELSNGLPPVLAGVPSSFSEPNEDAAPGPSPRVQKEVVPGHEIWVYDGGTTTFTFWRFMLEIPLTEVQMSVRYSINQGPEYEFFVPGRNQNMRWAAHSCNGFSAGVNPDDFRGPGYNNGYDPVWTDLLAKHFEAPYHVLVGGGDQLYCDALTREPELQDWVNTKSPSQRKVYPLTTEILSAIDRFYFNHYCLVFRSGAFACANSTIPMANMLDDHDIIDGFGSYPDDLQNSPIFSKIGSRGYFFYLLFQCLIVTEVDGVDRTPHAHTFRSQIIGGDGAYIPFPSHSILTYMGPKVWMLMLDCRAERRKDQVCSSVQYQRVIDALYELPVGVEHLIVQVGIPIAYPRMNFLEAALESKFNPLTALGRTGSLGLSSMVNKFNADAELLDDLNDHWTAKGHKKERNWFVEQLQRLAQIKRTRITFLSGDVHCAAVGVFKTLAKGKDPGVAPARDHRYMLNIVTSAIVNTPPPGGVLSMVSLLADKKHPAMHYANTDETMIPLFEKDPSGNSLKSRHIMGRRNWCSTSWDSTTGELQFDIRVEREKGVGETVGYPIRAPPPRWD
ncbi:hypothetical protein JB92DRAFT_2797405 [Gautieria morchelliformis]|nr:hypothetical protein JB92DRAFT_2797405 [Gautieria morchelliformis]